MQLLTSAQNPKVKLVRSLAQPKGRREAGLFLVEGTKLLREAVTWGFQPAMVFATAAWWRSMGGVAPIERMGGERYEVSEAVIAAIATTETPDPVVAAVPLPAASAAPLGPGALVVIAHRLQDPGNLGTIMRAADAAGAQAVVVTDKTVDPYAPKVVRASMGSLFHLPVLRMSLERFVAAHPAIPVFAMTLAGAESVYAFSYDKGAAFLIGNEGAGLAPEDEALAAHRVKIPILGHAESLNAAMAATVCLYEAARQRLARG